MKQEIFAIIVVLLIIFGGIGTLINYAAIPYTSQETKEIWAPQYFNIANIKKGTYASISDYKNETATLISFTDLKRNYNSSYQNENFEIYVLQNGTLWYEWSYQGIAYKAEVTPFLIGFWQKGGIHEGIITDTSSDGQKAYMTITWFIGTAGDASLFLTSIGLIVLALLVGYILYHL